MKQRDVLRVPSQGLESVGLSGRVGTCDPPRSENNRGLRGMPRVRRRRLGRCFPQLSPSKDGGASSYPKTNRIQSEKKERDEIRDLLES